MNSISRTIIWSPSRASRFIPGTRWQKYHFQWRISYVKYCILSISIASLSGKWRHSRDKKTQRFKHSSRWLPSSHKLYIYIKIYMYMTTYWWSVTIICYRGCCIVKVWTYFDSELVNFDGRFLIQQEIVIIRQPRKLSIYKLPNMQSLIPFLEILIHHPHTHWHPHTPINTNTN